MITSAEEMKPIKYVTTLKMEYVGNNVDSEEKARVVILLGALSFLKERR
jgi:hypothetical protein